MNPAENLRGRPSNATLRERNLRELVLIYNDKPVEERNRLDHLRLVQFHLSAKAFEQLFDFLEDGENESPCSSQGSHLPTPTASQAVLCHMVDVACSSAGPSATAEVSVTQSLDPFSFE